MAHVAQEEPAERVPLGALVDRELSTSLPSRLQDLQTFH
jgi:hypothetical protein